MKVRLDFEREDLEKMITTYFEKEGFKVKNLDELIEQFGTAFPEGLSVQAEIAEKPQPTPRLIFPGAQSAVNVVTSAVGTMLPQETGLTVADETVEAYADLEEDDKPLSMTDLLDPTNHRRGDAEESAQVLKIVQQSKQLERELTSQRRR